MLSALSVNDCFVMHLHASSSMRSLRSTPSMHENSHVRALYMSESILTQDPAQRTPCNHLAKMEPPPRSKNDQDNKVDVAEKGPGTSLADGPEFFPD